MASILIIDDEVAIATAFAMFFRHDGSHTVAEAYTGTEGIAAYNRLRPDLVLLDVRLPDMTGFDVLAAIREHNPVVIMVTAFGDVPMAVDALHKGAENFLTKPVDLSHLAVAAERALEKAQLRRLSHWLERQARCRHATSSSGRHRRCSNCRPRSRCWRRATARRRSSSARAALARDAWPGCCTRRARARASPLST